MGTMSDRLKVFDKEWNKTWSGVEKVGERLKGFGANLTVGITAPLGVLAGVSVKAFGDFDAAMNESLAIMGEVSSQLRGEMVNAARQMAKESTFSAAQAAESYYFLASAGLDAAATIKAMPVVTKFAQAGMFDMAKATELLVASQSALGLSIQNDAVANMQNMIRVSDVLSKANIMADGSVQQFAEALTNKAAAALRLVNKDIEEGVAVLAAFAKQGVKGEEAGEKLAIVMRDLQNAAIGQKEEFKQLGIGVFDSAGNLRNMADIVQDLEKAMAGMSDEQKRSTLTLLGFQDRSVSALQSLLGFSGEIRRYEAGLRQAAGTTEEISSKQLQTFNAQMTLMKNRLTDAAISIGSALVPMLQNLAVRLEPVIQFVTGLAESFGKMDPALQTIIVSLAAVAAAAGPLLFVSGQMITSFAAVAKGIGALQIALGATSGLGAVLTAVSPLAIAFGIAIAGWAIYKAVQEIQMLERQMKSLESALASGGKATTEQAKAIELLENMLRRAGKEIPSSFDFEDKIKPVQQYVNELVEAAKKHGLLGESIHQLDAAFKKTGESAGGAGKSIADLKAHFDALGKKATEAANSYKAVLAAYQAGKATIDQVTAAQVRLMQAQDAADPERAAKRQEKAHDEMSERYDKLVEDWIANTKKLNEANEGFADSVSTLAITFGKAHEEMAKKAKEAVEIIVPLNKRLPEGLQEAIKHTKEVSDAYHQLGQKTPAELQKVVDANRKAWETVKQDAGTNSVAALGAWITMRESEIELARRSGVEVTRAEDEQLRKAKEQLDQHLGKKEESWKRFTKQVSTIINDLAKDLAAGTVTLLKGLFGFDDFNKKLAADSANLRAELADRSQAIEDFRAEVEESIAGVNSKYADQLASETADLMESLAERRREYAEYTLDVAQQIETLRGKEAARLYEEQRDLADKLRDKEGEYERFVGDVAEKEQDIRRNHEEQLRLQLRSLRENLAERVEAYEDFVTDANAKLGRIAGDLEESIRDATRSTNRRIEDENTDFARDQEKLNEDLRKAEAKGDKEQVASIRKNLAQRQSDHERTITRLREDLAEQVRDARRRAEEQTADAKLQLDRRERDHAQFLAENARAQHEATEKHRIEQAEQLADLQESLDERTAALIAFRQETADAIAGAAEESAARLTAEEADLQKSLDERLVKLNTYEAEVNRKIDDLTAKYGAKQAEEVAALEKGFNDKLKEYDKYRSGVEQKLAELEAAHKGPLDRIREMFAGVFESATQAILRMASEEVLGKLLGKLKSLITEGLDPLSTVIKNLPTLPDWLPGAGKPSVPSVPGGGSIPGGGAGGAATAASKTLGTITAVSSVLSAVTDVLSFLGQRHIEKDVAGIEVTTRAIFAEIFTLRADSWDRETNLMGKLDDLWRGITEGSESVYKRIGEVWNTITAKSDDLITAVRDIGPLLLTPFTTIAGTIEDQLARIRTDLLGATSGGGFEVIAFSESVDKLTDINASGFESVVEWLKTINTTLTDGVTVIGTPGAALPGGAADGSAGAGGTIPVSPLESLVLQLADTDAQLAGLVARVNDARAPFTGDYAPTAEMIEAWNQVLNTAAIDSARLVAVRGDLEARILSATPIRDRPIVIHNHLHMDSREIGGAIVRASELAGGAIP